MATQQIPYWSYIIGERDVGIFLSAALHISVTPDDEYADFKKSYMQMNGAVIHLSRAGLAEAEAAIDKWAMDRSPPTDIAKEAHRLCCRLQQIGRCEPSGYDQVELPAAKPVERQASLFDTEQQGVRG